MPGADLLDPRTFAVTGGFAAAVQALAILYVWTVLLRDRSLLALAGAAALASLAAILAISRPHLHPVLTHAGATIALVAGHALGAYAFAASSDAASRWRC